jgi:HSP20 family molecular chaperone IbpA
MYKDPQDMFREMDTLFSQIFARMTRDFSAGEIPAFSFYMIMPPGEEPLPVHDTPCRGSTEPVAEVHRIEDEVKVIAELPGATMDAIKLRLNGSVLIIDAADDLANYHTTAELPPVDPGSMQTTCKNGVLEVTFKVLPDISEKESS